LCERFGYAHSTETYNNMISKITSRIHNFAKAIEKPVLFKVELPRMLEKLNMEWFQSLNIDTVLDIGGNKGQFTKTISVLLPEARIYGFEPLPFCFDEFQKFADKNQLVKVFNVGIGDVSGKMSFESDSFSPSSSFLKMTDIHRQAYPYAGKEIKTVDVKIVRLDGFITSEKINLGNSLFIKIDVQGYEDKVLAGGKETIKKAKIVIVETSFSVLYESQPLFGEIYQTFHDLGFSFSGMLEQSVNPVTGEVLQGDAIFINKNT
jgi:FkbM family methyltransferase